VTDTFDIDERDLRALYDLLEQTKPMRQSTNLFVSVAADRVVALIVDVLFELDPELADPWQHLAPGVTPIIKASEQ
jgi:hypothetical protein